MKKALWILGSIILMIGLLMGSFMLLGKHIYGRQDCERFNIDNIELRTGINIPEVVSSECNCTENNKTSTFLLDTQHVDIPSYLVANKFESANEIYVKNGDNPNTKWEAEFYPETNELKFEIEYKN